MPLQGGKEGSSYPEQGSQNSSLWGGYIGRGYPLSLILQPRGLPLGVYLQGGEKGGRGEMRRSLPESYTQEERPTLMVLGTRRSPLRSSGH